MSSTTDKIRYDASLSNPIYGGSDTVQPPALTLLPCIKAFDAATNPGLIDITELAKDVSGKLDKTVNGINVKYITGTYNDGKNWYRKWSDGWLDQGGWIDNTAQDTTVTLHVPFSSVNYSAIAQKSLTTSADTAAMDGTSNYTTTSFVVRMLLANGAVSKGGFMWYAYGQGA